MTDLQVRRVRFDFASEDVPFNWQPRRPAFAMQCNFISFFAVGFEKLIVDATREGIPLMRDRAVAEEAQAYLKQEAQHTAAHASHLRALVKRWPGLQQTVDEIVESYDHLTATKPLAWRLAYPAVIEATFTPYFKVFLDHEDKLFAPGDERVASLFIWHFVEEIEHRSSALRVYDAVHDSYLYRLKTIVGVLKHLDEIMRIVHRGVRHHVPADEGGEIVKYIPNGLSRRGLLDAFSAQKALPVGAQKTYAGVPRREMARMLVGLVRSQGPSHDPESEALPEFAGRWFARYSEEPRSAGRWYSIGARRGERKAAVAP